MHRKILVPLRGRDSIAEFLPYLHDISQPGMIQRHRLFTRGKSKGMAVTATIMIAKFI